MAKKAPQKTAAKPYREDVVVAAQAVVDLFDGQPAPLQELAEAVATLRATLERRAGRQLTVTLDLIDTARSAGHTTARAIAEYLHCGEATVRRRLAEERRAKGEAEARLEKSPVGKPTKKGDK